MFDFTNISLIVIAYLIGSIPSAVWIGKIFYRKDIRDFGSGNSGAANTFRILGVKAGIPVLIIDMLKGFAAVKLIQFSTINPLQNEEFILMQLILGVAAVMGHIFPVFAGFKGGKGVATLAGFVLAIHPLAALLSLAVFIVVLLLTRFVSLGSLSAGFAFPAFIIFAFNTEELSLIIFSLLVAVLLVLTHRKNISRLFRGNESKANLFKKKNK